MPETREDIVSAVRLWLGTPYRHQASARGHGADCLGLVRGVWRDVMGREPEAPPPYTMDWSETGVREALWEGASRHLSEAPVDRMFGGDVLLFRMREGMIAKHLGILTVAGPEPRFVHAYSRHGVIENSLSAPWQRRIVAVFRFPPKE